MMNFNLFNKIALAGLLFANVSKLASMQNPESDSDAEVVRMPGEGRPQDQATQEARFRQAVADAQRILLGLPVGTTDLDQRRAVMQHLTGALQIDDQEQREAIYQRAREALIDVVVLASAATGQEGADNQSARPRHGTWAETISGEGGWTETAASLAASILEKAGADPDIVDQRCVVS